MFKIIYPQKTATIYSRFPTQNTGLDQVLEIQKNALNEPSIDGDESVYFDRTYNSRILIQFDLNLVSGSTYSNAEYFLTLRDTNAVNLPTQYSLYAYPISGSWNQGRGYLNNNPINTEGVSWKYRYGKNDGRVWETSSLATNVTASYSAISHGGCWFTSSFASQSFDNDVPDIRMNVTSIVRHWLSGSIQNNGFILKYSDIDEFDLTQRSLLQFYSLHSHTIYLPRLEVYWPEIDHSGTSSIQEITDDDFVLYLKNIKDEYLTNEKPKIRLGIRERFPQETYATSSIYLGTKRLPVNSYFQIMDSVTDEVIIPFHPSGTILNCDTNGNYLKANISALMPERYYKFQFKANFDAGETIRILDNNFIFKVRR